MGVGLGAPAGPVRPLDDRVHADDRSAAATATRQALYAWYEHEPVALWRDAAMTMGHDGYLRQPPALTLPSVMRLLRAGLRATSRPGSRSPAAGSDQLEMRFEPEEYVRIVVPDEVDPMGVVVLNEVSGRITAKGDIAGTRDRPGGDGCLRAPPLTTVPRRCRRSRSWPMRSRCSTVTSRGRTRRSANRLGARSGALIVDDEVFDCRRRATVGARGDEPPPATRR